MTFLLEKFIPNWLRIVYLFIIYLFILTTQAEACFRINWQCNSLMWTCIWQCLPQISSQLFLIVKAEILSQLFPTFHRAQQGLLNLPIQLPVYYIDLVLGPPKQNIWLTHQLLDTSIKNTQCRKLWFQSYVIT